MKVFWHRPFKIFKYKLAMIFTVEFGWPCLPFLGGTGGSNFWRKSWRPTKMCPRPTSSAWRKAASVQCGCQPAPLVPAKADDRAQSWHCWEATFKVLVTSTAWSTSVCYKPRHGETQYFGNITWKTCELSLTTNWSYFALVLWILQGMYYYSSEWSARKLGVKYEAYP